MSRETDSPSPGPRGHGGPPSSPGTEPYGPPGSDPSGTGADPQGPADEPKTETTLTTRIRINIPGSRPIPPVVMRKPVDEDGSGDEDDTGAEHERAAGEAANQRGTGSGSGSAPPPPSGAGGANAGAAAGATSTSDWFAPRKPPRPAPEGEPARDEEPGGGGPALGGDGSGGVPRSALADLLDDPPPGASPPSPPGPPPSGRTTGPQTGDMTLTPPPAGRPAPTGPPSGASKSALYEQGYPGDPEEPRRTGQRPEPGAGGEGHIAGDTLVSGIPRVPSVDSVFPPDAPAPRPTGHGFFDDGEDREGRAGRDGSDDGGDRVEYGDYEDDARRRKGRSKLVLAGVSVVGALAIAYGAGLLLDHADVPQGTTVLGVDIGGKSRQDAVNTLDAALKGRTTDPLTLVVNGKETEIRPEVLGLTVDTEETVREASGRDYNPVSVIGSLFGGSRVVQAEVGVDEEKLKSAVESLSQDMLSGAAKDGKVVFTGGRAKAVPGEPHKAVDVPKAANLIEQAYRERAASGRAEPVSLPVSTQQPEISEQELQAAVDGFGKTAMSGWVWLQAGDVTLPFSEDTIGTFLTMKAGGEKLVPVIDPEKLAQAYGSSFDGVVVDGGAGTVPMTPEHAAAAMVQALKQPAPPAPEKRIAEVPGSRSR